MLLAADWQVMGGILKIARCIWEVGVAGSPVIGRRRGAFSTLQAAWTAGFHWWHSGNKKRTQNISEYMLVLVLCLVNICDISHILTCDLKTIYHTYQQTAHFSSLTFVLCYFKQAMTTNNTIYSQFDTVQYLRLNR